MSSWQPNSELLAQILNALHNITNPQFIQQVEQSIKQCAAQLPEWPLYLVHILTACAGEDATTRSAAALLLKQYFEAKPEAAVGQPGVVAAVKTSLVQLLADAEPRVRHQVASVVTRVLSELGLAGWPELLAGIRSVLAAADSSPVLLDGALYALKLIVEDQREELNRDENGAPINALAPLLLRYTACADAHLREYALYCIAEYAIDMPPVYQRLGDELLKALFACTADAVPGVRRLACRALVSLAQLQTDVVEAYMDSIVKYLLSATQDPAREVVEEALAFWEEVDPDDGTHEAVRPYLAQLVPLLVALLQFTPEDVQTVLEDERRYLSGAAKGVRPQHHAAAHSQQQQQQQHGDDDDGDYEDDDEDDEDDDEDAMAGAEAFPVRQSASAALNALAQTFGGDILPFAVPAISARMGADAGAQWPVLESALYALGAIAPGCSEALGQQVPALLSFIGGQLQHARACVRLMCCWALGRFAAFIADDVAAARSPQEADGRAYRAVLLALLGTMRDPHPGVRQSACTAFANVAEAAGSAICRYLDAVVPQLVAVYGEMRAGECAGVYDAINVTIEAAGEGLRSNGAVVSALVQPLAARWNALPDSDDEFEYLLECMGVLATALGAAFAQFAPPIFARCVAIISAAAAAHKTLVAQRQQQQQSHQQQSHFLALDVYEEEHCGGVSTGLLQCALDFVDGLTDSLAPADVAQLFGTAPVAQLAFECCAYASPDVLESAFCLVGDLARIAPASLQPYLALLVPVLVQRLEPSLPRVYTNASWAFGNIAMRCPDAVLPHVPVAAAKVAAVLEHIARFQSLASLLANTAIVCGRLVLVAPDFMAPRLAAAPKLFATWCGIIRRLPEDLEKIDAVRGLCTVCARCPAQVGPLFADVAAVFARLSYRPDAPDTADIYGVVAAVLASYKQLFGAAWPAQLAQWSAKAKVDLARKYPTAA